jgi:mono/diheme cytochrome c family protein
VRTLVLAFSVLGLVAACGDRRGELREWQPTDHQPPPAVTPEGQGTGQEDAPEGDPGIRAAQALWGMRCASCHGTTGRGDGAARPPGIAFPDMSQAAFHDARSDQQLAEVITKGRGLMPAFGQELSDAGIAALVRHIRALKQ